MRGRLGLYSSMQLGGYDADAAAYIAAVEFADGQALETGVKDAINAFVVGLKADGLWVDIGEACIFMGARTLTGALVPLRGSAPTAFNYVVGDYNRTNGLKGNGTTKYLTSNRTNTADGQNDTHLAVFTNSIATTSGVSRYYMDTIFGVVGRSYLARSTSAQGNFTRLNSATVEYRGPEPPSVGFFGVSRDNSANYTVRTASTNYTITDASQTRGATKVYQINRNDNGTAYSDAPLAYYSIGSALSLSTYESRINQLAIDIGIALYDADAASYIAAVEFADGQALEIGVKSAINDFVVGLKADGIWDSVLSCAIMMGARTLDGALVPLKGSSPTSVNFVSGDYNRKTGFLGNQTNKYIDTNFQDVSAYRIDNHVGVFQTAFGASGSTRPLIAARNTAGAGGSNQILRDSNATPNANLFNRGGLNSATFTLAAVAFIAMSRGSSSQYLWRHNGSGNTVTNTADASVSNVNYRLFTREGSPLWNSNRMNFYTIGTHIDATGLTNYETRVTTLYNAISAAIP
jgi:hypothetical protein